MSAQENVIVPVEEVALPGKAARRSKGLLLWTLLKRADFLASMLAGALLLAAIYYWLLLQASTVATLFTNIASEPVYAALLKILVPLSLLAFGLNFALSIFLFRAGGGLKWQGGSLLGGLAGAFGAGCPVCGALLLSLVGVGAGLAALPFGGLELWTLSGVVMAVAAGGSLTQLDRKTCDPVLSSTAPGGLCWKLPASDARLSLILLFLALDLAALLFWMLARNEPLFLLYGVGPAVAAAQGTQPDMNAQRSLAPGDSALFEQVQAEVLPEADVTLPIRWGDWLPEAVELGIIDMDKLEASFANRGGLTDEQRRLLAEGSDEFITISHENSWFTVIALWPLGLANQVDINRASPIAGERLFNFASTGGWSLGEAENGGAYFNKFELVSLTPEQEALVRELAENSYRPCCNNSTFFQDCNHGSALLGLLELGASQGVPRQELARAALVANSFWFPQNYLTTAMYFKVVRGMDWDDVDAEEVLGIEYSSASGANRVAQQVAALGAIPEGAFGVQCGVR